MNLPRFDGYSLRARIMPVLLAVCPLLSVCLFASQLGAWYAAVPAIFVVAAGLLAEEITRQLGKDLERRLVKEWDGLPTVRSLRHRSPDEAHLRTRRRREVSQLSEETLPTAAEEAADPVGTDERYDDAVRRCLSEARKRSPKGLLADENARYGFRRNLLALKPIALALMVAVAGLNCYLGISHASLFALIGSLVLIAIDFALWVAFVRKSWVRDQADTFSQRFFLEIGSLS